MNGYGVPPVPIRFYADADREQIERFTCSPYSPSWQATPQEVIREAPSCLDEPGLEILVAHDGLEVVGVAVFQFSDGPTCYVHSLGVARERQNQGIGGSLKRAVLVVTADRYPGLSVESQVHKNNVFMRQINSGLQAETEPYEEDREYLVTVVKPKDVPGREDVTPSK